jgi:hypothetical protein
LSRRLKVWTRELEGATRTCYDCRKAQVSSKGRVGAVLSFGDRTTTNGLCNAARFTVKKGITWRAYPRQVNVHTSLIFVSGILNNGEFVGFRNLVNEFEHDLRTNWIISMHYIYSNHQMRLKNVIGLMFENGHDQVNT